MKYENTCFLNKQKFQFVLAKKEIAKGMSKVQKAYFYIQKDLQENWNKQGNKILYSFYTLEMKLDTI